jgi:transketolase
VPDGVKEAFSQAVATRGRPLREAWEALLARYRAVYPALAAELDQLRSGTSPGCWQDALPTFAPDAKGLASREAGGKVLNAVAPHLPSLIGGAADLRLRPRPRSPARHRSDQASAAGATCISACANMPWARSPMAWRCPICALRHVPGLCRLYARADPPCRDHGTAHDLRVHPRSIGVGEDGPTHQPIEHLATLRAIPGLDTIRPGDANEVAVAWHLALESTHTPGPDLSRQAIPTLDRAELASAEGVARSAYVLGDCAGAGS